jgi:hypothetical protein
VFSLLRIKLARGPGPGTYGKSSVYDFEADARQPRA